MAKTVEPKAAPSDLVSLMAALLLLLIGVGCVGVAIKQAFPLARARIELERHPVNGVTGSFSYVLFGLPIFWLSLDGLNHLEDQDYSRYHMQSNRYRGTETISRLGFVDASGKTLAWTERAPVMNNSDAIRHFLAGDTDKLEYQQEPAFQVTYHDISGGVFAMMFLLGSGLSLWLGTKGVFCSLFEVRRENPPSGDSPHISRRSRRSARASLPPP